MNMVVVFDRHFVRYSDFAKLEAENARLKAEVERLEKADETRAQDISRLTIERDTARDRLAEALKALDKIANWPDGGNNYGQENIKRFARRALEGDKINE